VAVEDLAAALGVAGEEFCLAMSRQGSRGKAFDAMTRIHRPTPG
jgi:hypothetical protein